MNPSARAPSNRLVASSNVARNAVVSSGALPAMKLCCASKCSGATIAGTSCSLTPQLPLSPTTRPVFHTFSLAQSTDPRNRELRPGKRGATHGFGCAEDFLILYGTLAGLYATVRVDAVTDDVARPTVRPGTTCGSPLVAQRPRPVESLSAEPGVGGVMELADSPRTAQRHGSADPAAQDGGARLD